MNKYIKHGKEWHIQHAKNHNPEWFASLDSDTRLPMITYLYRHKYYFVTSDKIQNEPRRYTVRALDVATGDVTCVSAFMGFAKGYQAEVFIGKYFNNIEEDNNNEN